MTKKSTKWIHPRMPRNSGETVAPGIKGKGADILLKYIHQFTPAVTKNAPHRNFRISLKSTFRSIFISNPLLPVFLYCFQEYFTILAEFCFTYAEDVFHLFEGFGFLFGQVYQGFVGEDQIGRDMLFVCKA